MNSLNLSRIKWLVDLISQRLNTKVIFLDFVSTEKKLNAKYKLYWIAQNGSVLDLYHRLINNYFEKGNGKENNISLLFLNKNEKNYIGFGSRHHVFPNLKKNNEKENSEREIDFNTSLLSEFNTSSESITIPSNKEQQVIENWENCILKKLPISSALFSKIDFKIKDKEFVAAIWIGFNNNIKTTNYNTSNGKRKLSKIKLILENFLWSFSSNSIASELITNVEKQATKASISQLMARNMSHNIGSHVLNKLDNPKYLENFSAKIDKLNSYQTTIELSIRDKNKFSQFAIFNNYLKCRMDYLSDVSFGVPLMQNSKFVYEEVYKELDKCRLLLENISGLSENFKYKIIFKKDSEEIKENNDFKLAFPNDILGVQAFYNILENIIRNTAKHSQGYDDELKIFTIKFSYIKSEFLSDELKEETKKFIQVDIYDSVDLKIHKKQNIRFETTNDEMPYSDWLIYNQNYKLNLPIYSKNNQLRSNALGLMEMMASAGYLRKLNLNFLDDNELDINHNENIFNDYEKLNVIKAVKIKENNKEHLGYRFFINKPQEILFLLDVKNGFPENIDDLQNEGILFIHYDAFIDRLKKLNKPFNHNFLVYDISIKSNLENVLTEYDTSLPFRTLKINKKDKVDLLKMNCEDIINWCWEKYINSIIDFPHKTPIIDNSIDKNTDFSIVFLDHLYSENTAKSPTELFEENSEAFYLEALSSNAQSKMPSFYSLTRNFITTDKNEKFKEYLRLIYNQENKIALYKILEAVFSKVVVIDERIQEATKQEFMEISFGLLFKKINIIIPETHNSLEESDINLYSKKLSEKKDEIFRFIDNNIESNKNTFVLIHYGILERIFINDIDKSNSINDKLIELSKKCRIIITSGRGVPLELTDKVRFINLSSIFNALIDIRSKYAINNLLHSSRKANNNKQN